MNIPKRIGTAGEVVVLKTCQLHGFPYARRTVLSGVNDKGDIHLGDGTDSIIEVKAGQQCKNLTPGKMAKWIAETRVEARNAGAQVAFLVTQRAGYGLQNGHRWFAHVPHEFYLRLTGIEVPEEYVTHELGEVLELIREHLNG